MGVEEEEEEEEEIDDIRTSLLHRPSSSVHTSSSTQTVNNILKRTGNEWTALAHIITAVIGSGVLSLAWSVAQLGWIAGPLAILCFASAVLTSAFLLCNCHKSTNPETGTTTHGSLLDAVHSILGEKSARFCDIIVQVNFVKIGIVYTVTSATSISAIQKSNCFHYKGHEATCQYSNTTYMLIFGSVQGLVSQIPDFHHMEWLSIVSAIMSFAYSFIGSGLSLATIIDNGEIKGSTEGLPSDNASEKVWSVAQAIGDIAFSLSFSIIFLEIQDTLKAAPPEKVTMKKASTIAICIVTFFYLSCGAFGYAAFGVDTPGNLLTGFGFYEPYWLVDLANACVVLHLVGGYQVYSQPLFANVERWFRRKFPESKFANKNYDLKLLTLPAFKLNLLRLVFRSWYVATITGIAIVFPYFNEIVGVAGAINYWPVVVYFPVQMYLKQKKIECWTTKKIVLCTYMYICLVVMVFAFVGFVRGLIVARFSQGTFLFLHKAF